MFFEKTGIIIVDNGFKIFWTGLHFSLSAFAVTLFTAPAPPFPGMLFLPPAFPNQGPAPRPINSVKLCVDSALVTPFSEFQ